MICENFIVLSCAIVALVSVGSVHAEEELPVVEINFKGQQVRVPYYENREPITEIRHEIDNNIIAEIGDIVKTIAHDALVSEANILKKTSRMFSSGKKLIDACNRNKAQIVEQRRLNKAIGKATKEGYMTEMGGLVEDILAYDICSKKVVPKEQQPEWCSGKSPDKKLSQEHVDKIGDYLDMFRELVKESPLGAYVNWRHMTIDGRSITEAFGEETSFFRRSGYSAIIKVMSWLSSSLKKM